MSKLHKRFYLAIDQGGQSSRAILFGSKGCAIDRAQFEVPTQRAGDGGCALFYIYRRPFISST